MEHRNEKTTFHHRLDQKIIEAGLSYRELSLRIGKGETYIATLVRNRNDPGLSTVVDICNALKIGLADLLPESSPANGLTIGAAWQVEDIAEEVLFAVAKRARLRDVQGGSKPTLDEIFEWWHRQGGRLENFDELREHIDLFTPPPEDARMPVPARLGHDSLVARTFGVEDEDNLRHLLNHLDTKLNKRIAQAHSEAHLRKLGKLTKFQAECLVDEKPVRLVFDEYQILDG